VQGWFVGGKVNADLTGTKKIRGIGMREGVPVAAGREESVLHRIQRSCRSDGAPGEMVVGKRTVSDPATSVFGPRRRLKEKNGKPVSDELEGGPSQDQKRMLECGNCLRVKAILSQQRERERKVKTSLTKFNSAPLRGYA